MLLLQATLDLLLRMYIRMTTGGRDRGDVPGWVLITLMTAGLVAGLWAIAGPKLEQLLSDALSNVKGP